MFDPDAPPDPAELDRAVTAVVNDCLQVKEGEEVLVIANPATLGLGERLRGEAGRAGADAVLALMAERATHAAEPPATVAAAMKARRRRPRADRPVALAHRLAQGGVGGRRADRDAARRHRGRCSPG